MLDKLAAQLPGGGAAVHIPNDDGTILRRGSYCNRPALLFKTQRERFSCWATFVLGSQSCAAALSNSHRKPPPSHSAGNRIRLPQTPPTFRTPGPQHQFIIPHGPSNAPEAAPLGYGRTQALSPPRLWSSEGSWQYVAAPIELVYRPKLPRRTSQDAQPTCFGKRPLHQLLCFEGGARMSRPVGQAMQGVNAEATSMLPASSPRHGGHNALPALPAALKRHAAHTNRSSMKLMSMRQRLEIPGYELTNGQGHHDICLSRLERMVVEEMSARGCELMSVLHALNLADF